MGTPPERDEGEVELVDDLDGRLRRARGARPVESSPAIPRSGLATALRLVMEMISALIVGGAIGWFLDRWLDTKPLFLLVFLLLGTVAGMSNAYRAAVRLSAGQDSNPTGN